MHRDTFNANFYITAATVIPVLYLALTLQSQTYERMISRAYREFQPRGRRTGWQFYRGIIVSSVLYTAILGTIYAGSVGEWLAISALYTKSASRNIGFAVLVALGYLVIIVVAGPAVRFFKATGGATDREFEDQTTERTSQPPSEDSEESPE